VAVTLFVGATVLSLRSSDPAGNALLAQAGALQLLSGH
jgi:hypothetical protein